MEQNIADALMEFYQKILKPEFDFIKGKLIEHDEKFDQVFAHFDTVYHRLGRLEDELIVINARLKRLEDAVLSCNGRQNELELRVQEMRGQLGEFQARLESLERQLAGQ
jgi:predicted nuclease with TOPRIM domain